MNFSQGHGKNSERRELQCHSITSDGAPAMQGPIQGFVGRVKAVNPTVLVTHCMLHRENLAAGKLSATLASTIKDVVEIVNFIKAGSLNCRLFKTLCEELGSEFSHLLFHSSVRWLSRGKVLRRLLDLRTEVDIFLTEKKHRHAPKFSDGKWLVQVAYLADLFGELNALNISMQGRDKSLVDLAEKLSAFKAKLQLWRRKVDQGKTASFPTVALMIEDQEQDELLPHIQPIIDEHLKNLVHNFDNYLPDSEVRHFSWIKMPFNIDVNNLTPVLAQIPGFEEELIDLQHSDVLKEQFSHLSLSRFWIGTLSTLPIISQEAIKALLPFATTYLCEQGFSALTVIKTKSRNALQPGDDMRCALTNLTPSFRALSSNKQNQVSH